MANRTGQGATVPQIDRRQGQSGDVGGVQYATQAPGNVGAFAENARGLAGVINGMVNNIENRRDIYAAVEASRNGTVAGMQDKLPPRLDEATIRGRAFNQAALDAVDTRLQLEMRKNLAQYEDTHRADPAGFKAKSDAFMQGSLQGLAQYDPRLAFKYKAEFELHQQSAIGRIGDRARAAARDRQMEGAILLQDRLDQDQQRLVSSLFTADGGPKDVTAIMSQLTANAARQVDVAHMIGADGRPLFTPRERAAAQIGAMHTVERRIGAAYLSSQEDKVAALEGWRSGKAAIDMNGADGTVARVPLRELLSPDGYAAAEKDFVEGLKSDLALRGAIDARQDHDFKKSSDTLYGDLATIAQGGQLTMSVVQAAKPMLETDRYLALQEMARKGGATVSDGVIMSDLIRRDAEGEDIQTLLRLSYRTGKLSLNDYQQMYDRNTARVATGLRTPVAAGSDFVSNSLGKMSTVLGPLQSAVIAQADAEYTQRITDFQEKEKRRPTVTEAIDIGKDVVRRYAVIDAGQQIVALPLPKFMTSAQKFSSDLSSQDVQGIVMRTRAEFLKSHGGNVEAMKADKAYQDEMDLLKQYYDLIRAKDANAAKPAK